MNTTTNTKPMLTIAMMAAAAVLVFTSAAFANPQVRAVGPGCIRNSECPQALVCHSSGVCMEQCRENRDCSFGWTCKAGEYSAQMGRAVNRCEPPAPPPPQSGQLAGLVETAPGKGSTCTVELGSRRASCHASTGEFLLADVAPGAYKLRLRVGRSTRDLTVYVNPAATTYLGVIPTAAFTTPLILLQAAPRPSTSSKMPRIRMR